MFCLNCGKETNNESNFCKTCGNRVEYDEIKSKPENSPKNNIFFKIQRKHIVLIIILIFALLVRLHYFNINEAIWWDEAEYLLQAEKVAFNAHYAPIYSYHRGILLPFIWGLILKIGLGHKSLLILQIIFSVSSIILLYNIAKILFGKEVALASSFIMAVFWEELFYVNRYLTEVAAVFISLLALNFFIEFYFNKKQKFLYFAAIAAGLGMLIRFPVGIFIIIIGCFLLITEQLALFKNYRYYLVTLILFLLGLPQIIYTYMNYGNAFLFLKAAGAHSAASQHLTTMLQYILFMPQALDFIFLALFLIGFIFISFDLILAPDYLIKKREGAPKKELLLILWIVLHFVVISLMNEFIDRMIFTIFPVISMCVGYGSVKIKDYIARYNKVLAISLILVLFLIGGYLQLKQADAIINFKKDSFLPFKEAGLWIKDNSNQDDLIIGSQKPILQYYAQRDVIDFQDFNDANVKPKYLVIIPGYPGQPEELFYYPQKNNLTLAKIFLYSQDQPSALIYWLPK